MNSIVVRLLRLGLPITFGRLGIIGMGIVDLIVVGQFAGSELPHLSLALIVNGPLIIGGIGLMLGVQVLTARALGADTPALAGKIWRKGLVVAACAGAAICLGVALAVDDLLHTFGVDESLIDLAAQIATVIALSVPFHLLFIATTNFLEGLERPVPGATTMWLANALNLALNLWLVPLFGALGSAWTTVAARVFLAAALLGYVLRARPLRAFLRHTAAQVSYRALLAIGAAAAVSSFVEAGAFASMGVIAGRVDANSLATFNIATGGLLSLIGMISLGLGNATAVLVSFETGRADTDLAKRIGWTALGLNTTIMLGIGLACVGFADLIASAFTSNLPIAALFAAVMWLTAVLFIPDTGQMVVDPALRARGENWLPTTTRFVAFVLIAPPLAWWLVEVEGYDLTGVFVALIFASSLAFIVLTARWYATR